MSRLLLGATPRRPGTVTAATKDGATRLICRARYGWPLPPEEGPGAYVDGTGAYAECVRRWTEAGWTVARRPRAA
jgi:hypothetical protein